MACIVAFRYHARLNIGFVYGNKKKTPAMEFSSSVSCKPTIHTQYKTFQANIK